MTAADLEAYYDNTRFDYRFIWNGRGTRAIHFGYYDKHAVRHHAALENMNRVMADLAQIRPGDRVLDAGCGWGSASFWLARHRQARTTGISLVKAQVEACRHVARRHPAGLTDFVVADYCATPFPDQTFDVVWACESLCHAAIKADFYREAFRVLKPGGRLVLAEYIRAERPESPAREALLRAWLHPWAIPDIDTPAEHRAQALAAGFSTFDLRDVTANVRPSLRNLHTLSRQWLPLGRALHALRMLCSVRLNNAQAAVCQYEALQEGLWWYGMALAAK